MTTERDMITEEEEQAPTCDPAPMGEWIEGGEEDECRPCVMAPVIQWYRDELQEQGYSAMSASLEEVALDDDLSLLALANKLDTIKTEVPGTVRSRLLEFDCAAQNFSEEATDG